MEVQSQEMLNIVLTHFQGGLGALEHAKLSPVECRKIFIREGLKKIMENSIIAVSYTHLTLPTIFRV